MYVRVSDDKALIHAWDSGVYMAENVQRNKNVKEAFLSRVANTSAEESASISWKFDFGKYKMDFGALRATSCTFRSNASVTWRIHDGANTNRFIIPNGGENPISLHKLTGASSLVLSAFLRGGIGDEACFQTRLFNESLDAFKEFPLEIWVRVRPREGIEKWEKPKGKSFTLTKKERDKGEFHLRYSSASDKYIRVSDDDKQITGWQNGVYAEEDICRKAEYDSQKAYLSRKNSQTPDDTSFISWKFDFGGYQLDCGSLLACSSLHHKSASVLWKLEDGMNPDRYVIPTGAKEVMNLEELKGASSLVLSAFMCGGVSSGGVAWQHTQLFRQNITSHDKYPFEIKLQLTKSVTIFDKVEELSIAAMNNDIEYLHEVLNCVKEEYGVSELSIIHTNSQGDTPLHVAMKYGALEAAKCLIDTFPSLLNLVNRDNALPMEYADDQMKTMLGKNQENLEPPCNSSQTDTTTNNNVNSNEEPMKSEPVKNEPETALKASLEPKEEKTCTATTQLHDVKNLNSDHKEVKPKLERQQGKKLEQIESKVKSKEVTKIKQKTKTMKESENVKKADRTVFMKSKKVGTDLQGDVIDCGVNTCRVVVEDVPKKQEEIKINTEFSEKEESITTCTEDSELEQSSTEESKKNTESASLSEESGKPLKGNRKRRKNGKNGVGATGSNKKLKVVSFSFFYFTSP
ncbi:uncharacterized protein LOC100367056 [Saccoglossus kowalevskii]